MFKLSTEQKSLQFSMDFNNFNDSIKLTPISLKESGNFVK